MANDSIPSAPVDSHAAKHRAEQHGAAPGERPAARIRALLARTRPLSGCDVADVYWEGRSLVDSLALAYEAETDYTWSSSRCATVLEFLAHIEPTEANCICNDLSDVNATCGLQIVYEFIADRPRRGLP
jgi:hypothetical protein